MLICSSPPQLGTRLFVEFQDQNSDRNEIDTSEMFHIFLNFWYAVCHIARLFPIINVILLTVDSQAVDDVVLSFPRRLWDSSCHIAWWRGLQKQNILLPLFVIYKLFSVFTLWTKMCVLLIHLTGILNLTQDQKNGSCFCSIICTRTLEYCRKHYIDCNTEYPGCINRKTAYWNQVESNNVFDLILSLPKFNQSIKCDTVELLNEKWREWQIFTFSIVDSSYSSSMHFLSLLYLLSSTLCLVAQAHMSRESTLSKCSIWCGK